MAMFALVHRVLAQIGVNPERFSLQWASAAEAPRFVKLITEFTRQIKQLGPLGESEGIAPDELNHRLQKGLDVLSDRKVRMFFGNAAKSVRKEGRFTQEYISSVIEEKLSKPLESAMTAEPEAAEAKKEAGGKKLSAGNESMRPGEKKVTAGKAKTAAAKKAVSKRTAPEKSAGKKAAIKKKASAPRKSKPKKKK
jgi:hypothetical protein